LQEISAWRKESVLGHNNDKPKQFDGKRHGGFYTQAELKDLVKYAQDRFITIIPEIEMPGHSQAVLAAYPEFGCKDTTYEVSTSWGVHKDVFCPNESTFTFLEDVLTEVMEIFPSKYIHIGGDEVPKDRWKESAYAQELIRKHDLKDEHGLQSYFIQRMEKFLNAKGRAIIGWDEILEGGLAPNATVMSWRGENGGIAAAKEKHNVIMTPNTYLYLDYYQTQAGRKGEPLAIGGFLPLEKVYSYNPLPAGLTAEEAKYILGAQANVWTEYIATPEQAFHMTFPRACALAEVAWTPVAQKDYTDFTRRLKQNVRHLEKRQVKYARYFQEGQNQQTQP
jgi:hexosaminidase